MIWILDLVLSFVCAARSPEWRHERAHVLCYEVADQVSIVLADAVCSDDD